MNIFPFFADCTNNTFGEGACIALLIARVFLGILFLFQGYEKLFKIGIRGVVDAFEAPMGAKHITRGVLYIAAMYTSVIELLGGLLLIVGLFEFASLSLLGIDLVLVALAFSMVKPVWDMQYVFPRLVLVLFLLMLGSNDCFSLDFFIFNK